MADISRTTTITVNGQTYRSADEMPPEVRRQYEQVMSLMADRNNDGVPDILEGRPPGESTVVSQVTTTSADFKLGPGGLRELQSSMRVQEPMAMTRPVHRGGESGGESGGGGITIRITWPTVFALLVVILIALVVWWLKSQ